jgi:hypothetical protein
MKNNLQIKTYLINKTVYYIVCKRYMEQEPLNKPQSTTKYKENVKPYTEENTPNTSTVTSVPTKNEHSSQHTSSEGIDNMQV